MNTIILDMHMNMHMHMNMNMHTLMCMCMSNDVHANRGDLRGYAERGYGTASRATASTTRAMA